VTYFESSSKAQDGVGNVLGFHGVDGYRIDQCLVSSGSAVSQNFATISLLTIGVFTTAGWMVLTRMRSAARMLA